MRRVPVAGCSSRPAVLGVVLALFSALWMTEPGHAHAEELGTRGNLVFSADRLFGLYFAHQSVEVTPSRDENDDRTSIGLGWSQPLSGALSTTPRLGIDYFLSNNFTLGGSIGFWSGSDDDSDVTTTAFLIAARAGYALRLGHSVTFWPRGGFTYSTYSIEDSSLDYYTFALTVEAPFCFALTEGFALTLGPNLDLGFLAERRSLDATETVFGLMFGLSGWTNL